MDLRKCVKAEGTDINDCKQISSGDYNSIVAALSKQPISVGIHANTFNSNIIIGFLIALSVLLERLIMVISSI